MAGSCIHLWRDVRVLSEISKRTGICVLLCKIEARSLKWPHVITSTAFNFTRSQPRSLLSMARLKSARSRCFSASSRRTLIAQTCFGFKGRFWPTMRPLFQAGRKTRMAGKLSVPMTDPLIRRSLPFDNFALAKKVYHMICVASTVGSRPLPAICHTSQKVSYADEAAVRRLRSIDGEDWQLCAG